MDSLKKCTMCKELKDKSDFIKKCGRCKPCRSIHQKVYRKNNLSSFTAKDKKSYMNRKETHNKKSAEYYKNNTEKIRNRRSVYYENNKLLVKKMNHERYMGNLTMRLGITYRNRVRHEMKTGKGYLEYLGCDIDMLKKWFEYNFEYNGFTWDSYGTDWEIDHVVPCCKWDLTCKDQVFKCFNWKNTQPTTCRFNRSKSGAILKWQILEQQLRLYLFEGILKSGQILNTAV